MSILLDALLETIVNKCNASTLTNCKSVLLSIFLQCNPSEKAQDNPINLL